MSLTVYHAPPARSVRVVWLLEELGVPYETVAMPLDRKVLTGDEYRAVNPTGKIPALKHDDLILFESVAIMEYLLARFGPGDLAPAPEDRLYGPYLQWLHYGEAGMGPSVTMALGHRRLLPEAARIEAMAKWGEREAAACFDVLAGPLSANDYLLPSGFSAADISVAYMLLLAKFAGMSKAFPAAVSAYFERCTARPGWKVATRG
ncbi:glutathione S-transferase family protein [Parvularcula dongshanensis]|uniref:Glutathione S-transferase n=1 Tax=Parvularcula dongshanensis TaxID=1173995 RepID=A0A840I1Y8_9PROT|nr:glutathione S-transferase family protein [Parvularcula dongshanensis]MBB4658767.1 glutathione S-transferase [Parvularcula dongshanensis]